MKVRLKSFFHFDVAKVFGSDQVEMPDHAATLRAVLEEVALRSGGAIEPVDRNSGMLEVDYFVLLNGYDSGSLAEGLETGLHDGDEVALGTNYHWGGG